MSLSAPLTMRQFPRASPCAWVPSRQGGTLSPYFTVPVVVRAAGDRGTLSRYRLNRSPAGGRGPSTVPEEIVVKNPGAHGSSHRIMRGPARHGPAGLGRICSLKQRPVGVRHFWKLGY